MRVADYMYLFGEARTWPTAGPSTPLRFAQDDKNGGVPIAIA